MLCSCNCKQLDAVAAPTAQQHLISLKLVLYTHTILRAQLSLILMQFNCVQCALRTCSHVVITNKQVKQFGSSTGSAQDLDALGRLMNRTDPPMRDQAQVSVSQ
jgi:galactokinase